MNQWASGAAYEPYVGRWSRLVARDFLSWLEVPAGSRWLDVGCGTGALTQTILTEANPAEVQAIDLSPDYVAYARAQTPDPRATFQAGSAEALPFEADRFDAVVSGLVLNFVPHPDQALAEMARVVRPGGAVGLYVWDYADRMQLMRHFWDAAVALNPNAQALDEGRRFPLCQPEPLQQLFQQASLHDVSVRPIDVPTTFRDFDDYWSPFLGGQGPAPSYAMSLADDQRAALRERIRSTLPITPDGSIPLIARAWAAVGYAPEGS
jgi:SAM-dependent methyltransferase